MSSSPRLIVVLIGAFLFLGAFVFCAQAAELTLSGFQLPGLTFITPLVDIVPAQTLTSFSFEPVSEGITVSSLPEIMNDTPLEAIVVPTPNEESTPTPIDTPSSTPTPTAIPSPTPTPTDTPTPTPTPLPQPITSPDYMNDFFQHYSDEYHVDKEQLKKIAKCESSFNTGASYMDYGGMFQFSSSSWSVTRTAMGQDPNPDLRYSAEESIKTAAFKISRDGSSAWPTCQ
jgi:hypothetical protein